MTKIKTALISVSDKRNLKPLLSSLKKNNVNIKAILTKSGKEFVTPLSITTLTKNKTFEDIFDKNSVVVMIFCDHGSRYMSKIYSDKWMSDQGFFDSEKTPLEKPIEYIK